jgi:hypothetical protein
MQLHNAQSMSHRDHVSTTVVWARKLTMWAKLQNHHSLKSINKNETHTQVFEVRVLFRLFQRTSHEALLTAEQRRKIAFDPLRSKP